MLSVVNKMKCRITILERLMVGGDGVKWLVRFSNWIENVCKMPDVWEKSYLVPTYKNKCHI